MRACLSFQFFFNQDFGHLEEAERLVQEITKIFQFFFNQDFGHRESAKIYLSTLECYLFQFFFNQDFGHPRVLSPSRWYNATNNFQFFFNQDFGHLWNRVTVTLKRDDLSILF